MSLEIIYKEKCNTPSDINEHLPTLKKYAEECDHVTEFGVRWIVSTYALLMGKPKKMVSYDIEDIEMELVQNMVKENTELKFIQGDSTKIEIEETDLLFIDTIHTYEHLKKELSLHSSKVKKYIILHDTTVYEWEGEAINGVTQKGLWPAIEEFLESNPNWVIYERFEYNNGLTILKRNI
jgi:cephalosporin hydroxylase